jgi:radical SAM superfamily enzyme YgiQ (UPF0313 family)
MIMKLYENETGEQEMNVRRALFVDLMPNFYDRHPIYSLASVLKKFSVECGYVCSSSRRAALRRVREFKPDVVLYSAFSSHIPEYMAFDRELKHEFPGVYSMIGGPGLNADASREQVRTSTIDAGCVGEGESALAHFLLEGARTKNLRPVSNLEGELEFFPFVELDSLPFPDRSVVYEADSLLRVLPSKQFMAGRGCPYKCTYCHNHLDNELLKSAGNPIRLKTVDYLMEEVLDVQRRFGVGNVVFQDDVFFLNKKWGFEFAEKFPRKVGLPFTCNVRSNIVNEDVVRALKQAGCVGIFWAIESGDEKIRNDLLKRYTSDDQILRAAELFNKYGIKHRVSNVIGIPGESFEQMLKTVDLNIRAKSYVSSAFIFIPFHDLELTQYALEKGYLDPARSDELPRTFADETALNFSHPERVRIRKLMALFSIVVKYPVLFRKKWLFKFLFMLPIQPLLLLNRIFYLVHAALMYRVSTGFRTKLRVLVRYFSYGT